jgi:flagellar hook-associated protein FlgK
MSVVEHPSPELETAMNNVFAAFDTYLADPNNRVLLDEMTQRIEELRRVGGLVITGEPE